MALRHHDQTIHEGLTPALTASDPQLYKRDVDLIVVDDESAAGIPDCPPETAGYCWNDLRGDASKRLLAEVRDQTGLPRASAHCGPEERLQAQTHPLAA
jgi:hypothetical protein